MAEKPQFDVLDDLSGEPLNAERMRRMKSLVRQLYKEEFDKDRLQLPPVKGRAVIIAVSFVSLILFASMALYNYNRFVNMNENVLSAMGHVEAAIQRRANLFDNLINLSLNQAAIEEQVFQSVAEVRTRIGQGGAKGEAVPPNGQAEAVASKTPAKKERTLMEAMGFPAGDNRLLAMVEQYPTIKLSDTFHRLMASLVEMEDRVSARRGEYNESARIFNSEITNFPWYMLAHYSGFRRYGYYETNAKPEQYLGIDLRTYKRLLPGLAPGIKGIGPDGDPPKEAKEVSK